jgi:CBS domain-containing protein
VVNLPPAKKYEKPVSKLRPKVPLSAADDCTISEVASLMASKRADAALLVNAEGGLSGIITDNDITRRVVSQYVDPSSTLVSAVMTKAPKFVHPDDSALDALEMMVDNKFRHLPVLDKNKNIVGLLDIAKCLYEAISMLEKMQESASTASETEERLTIVNTAMQAAAAASGGSNPQTQLMVMKVLMQQMFGDTIPTLRTIIGAQDFPSIMHTKNVRDAAVMMTRHRKGLLVLDEDDDLVGILTPKDILNRVLVPKKSPDLTAVASVMTPQPDYVSPDLTLLDALKEMHDHKYLHLPVCEENGKVVGLVDVMELMCHSAGSAASGGRGWRNFFSDAMDVRDSGDENDSDGMSDRTSQSKLPSLPGKGGKRPIATKYGKIKPKPIPDNSSDVFSIGIVDKHNAMSSFDGQSNYDGASDVSAFDFDFKVTDQDGNILKFRSSSDSIEKLKVAIAQRLKVAAEALLLKYVDEDDDQVLLDSDTTLRHAVEGSRSRGINSLKLSVTMKATEREETASAGSTSSPIAVATDTVPSPPPPSSSSSSSSGAAPQSTSAFVQQNQNTLIIAGGAAVVALVATVAFVFARKKS